MRKLLFAFSLLTGLMMAAPLPKTGTETRAFAPGGTFHLEVPVGDIKVRPGASSQIVLHYFLRASHGLLSSGTDPVELEFQVQGATATARFTYPDGGNHHPSIDVVVEVPAATRLRFKLGVGQIHVSPGIEGDETLKTGVGDIVVQGAGRQQFASVDAAAGVGSVDGGVWGNASGFIAHELQASGSGKYHLSAKTGVGSIHIER